MRKRELVHLHALLDRIRRFVARAEDTPQPGDTFDAYDDLDVAPPAVYESKGDHERAVTELATGLVELVESHDASDDVETPTMTTDLSGVDAADDPVPADRRG